MAHFRATTGMVLPQRHYSNLNFKNVLTNPAHKLKLDLNKRAWGSRSGHGRLPRPLPADDPIGLRERPASEPMEQLERDILSIQDAQQAVAALIERRQFLEPVRRRCKVDRRGPRRRPAATRPFLKTGAHR
jgi:hypothetical protein